MAGYNELLVGRYNRFLQKLMSMKGRKSLESLNPELQVVLNTFHGVENRYLEGWDRFSLAQVSPAVATLKSAVLFRMPFGSNVVAVIESLTFSQDAFITTSVKWVLSNLAGDLTTVVTGGRIDPRQPRSPSAITSNGTGSAGSAPYGSLAGTSGQFIQDESMEIPVFGLSVTALNALLVVNDTVNQQFTVGMIWRERLLEESERT